MKDNWFEKNLYVKNDQHNKEWLHDEVEGMFTTMVDSGRHFLIKDIVILYKVLSIFVVKSQLNWQCHTYMYNSYTDNFH